MNIKFRDLSFGFHPVILAAVALLPTNITVEMVAERAGSKGWHPANANTLPYTTVETKVGECPGENGKLHPALFITTRLGKGFIRHAIYAEPARASVLVIENISFADGTENQQEYAFAMIRAAAVGVAELIEQRVLDFLAHEVST